MCSLFVWVILFLLFGEEVEGGGQKQNNLF